MGLVGRGDVSFRVRRVCMFEEMVCVLGGEVCVEGKGVRKDLGMKYDYI